MILIFTIPIRVGLVVVFIFDQYLDLKNYVFYLKQSCKISLCFPSPPSLRRLELTYYCNYIIYALAKRVVEFSVSLIYLKSQKVYNLKNNVNIFIKSPLPNVFNDSAIFTIFLISESLMFKQSF